jgi:hypothetical protein
VNNDEPHVLRLFGRSALMPLLAIVGIAELSQKKSLQIRPIPLKLLALDGTHAFRVPRLAEQSIERMI